MASDPGLTEKIADDVKDYVGLRIDSVKLKMVESLSIITGSAISLVICMLLLLLALILFTGAAVYGLNLWIGSVIWSILIMGVLYILIGIGVFYMRRIFIDKMVGVFSNMFFASKGNDDEDDDE